MFPYYNANNQLIEMQNLRDDLDNKIQRMTQQMTQMPVQQPTNLTQNFQLANTTSNVKTANSIEDVKKEIVIVDTYFMANDLTSMWIKNAHGDIRTFEVKEIIPKDEKDLRIEQLEEEIKKLRGVKNESNKSSNELWSNANGEQIETSKSANVSNVSSSTSAKRKP